MKSSQGTVLTLTRIYSERELEEEECLKVTIKKGKMKIENKPFKDLEKWAPDQVVSTCGSLKEKWVDVDQFSSVAQSCPTLHRPHGPQHARPPCPSATPGVYSDSCPSSRWCHPIISASVVLFSSCLQSFPVSGSFQKIQLSACVWGVIKVLVWPVRWTTWSWKEEEGLNLRKSLVHRTLVSKHGWMSLEDFWMVEWC